MTELLWPSMWKWQTTKSLKNLLKTENRPVHPSPNKFFSLPTNLPMTGSLLWCFGLDISTEFYTLAGLLYIYIFWIFEFNPNNQQFFFWSARKMKCIHSCTAQKCSWETGTHCKAFTVEDIMNWWLTVNANFFFHHYNLGFVTTVKHDYR